MGRQFKEWSMHQLIALITIALCSAFYPALYAQDGSLNHSLLMGGVPAINGPIQYLMDESETLTIEDMEKDWLQSKWKESQSQNLSFGFTKSAVWVRFKLYQPAKIKLPTVFEVAYPPLDYVRFYQPENGSYKVIQVGDHFPFVAREFRSHNYAFTLSKNFDSDRYFYLRVKTGSSLLIPMRVFRIDEYFVSQYEELMIYGVYFGIVLAMVLYNLYLFWSFKDYIYGFYAIYMLGYSFYQLCVNGVMQQYIWPSNPHFVDKVIPYSISLGSASLALFSIKFLKLKKLMPFFYYLVMAAFYIDVFGLYFSIFSDYSQAVKYGTGSVAITSIILIIAAVRSYWTGYSAARYYLIAFTLFLTGATIFALKTSNVIPHNIFTHNAVQIGSALELILLSLALGDRVAMNNNRIDRGIKKLNEDLTIRSAEIQAIFEEKTKQVKKVIENVKTPFLVVDLDFKVMDGFSMTCLDLIPSLSPGADFFSYFGLSETELTRLKENILNEKVEDGKVQDELAHGVLRLSLLTRWVDLVPDAVYNDDGKKVAILITITDATYAIQMERKARSNRAKVNILSNQGAFKSVLAHVMTLNSDGIKSSRLSRDIKYPDLFFKAFDMDIDFQSLTKGGETNVLELSAGINQFIKKLVDDNFYLLNMPDSRSLDRTFDVYDEQLRSLETDAAESINACLSWVEYQVRRQIHFYFGALNLIATYLEKKFKIKIQLKLGGGHTIVFHPCFDELLLSLSGILNDYVEYYMNNEALSGQYQNEKTSEIAVRLEFSTNSGAFEVRCCFDRSQIDLSKLDAIFALKSKVGGWSGQLMVQVDAIDGAVLHIKIPQGRREKLAGAA